MKLNVAGMFSGIGGMEKGLERSGHNILQMCEIDAGARAILEKRFPNVPVHSDIRKVSNLSKNVELLAAGFPCQDLTQVGRLRGIEGSQSNLIREVFRLLEKRRVSWVLLENVPFMLRFDGGMAIRRVTKRLERLGYRWAYRTIDTRSFGIPQRRNRVFILASLDQDPRAVLLSPSVTWVEPCYPLRSAAHGFYWTEGNRGVGWAENAIPALKGGSGLYIQSPPAIVLTDGSIVTPTVEACEKLQGFPIGWTSPARVVGLGKRRHLYLGNAVTVNVVRWIGSKLANPIRYDDSLDEHLSHKERWPSAGWYDGKVRGCSTASTWPVKPKDMSLEEFIGDRHQPLSGRAAAGFLSRLEASSLRSVDGFRETLLRHVIREGEYGRFEVMMNRRLNKIAA